LLVHILYLVIMNGCSEEDYWGRSSAGEKIVRLRLTLRDPEGTGDDCSRI
jgi:hypothetical protein